MAGHVQSLAERLKSEPRRPFRTLFSSTWPLAIGIIIAVLMQTVLAPMLGNYYARVLLDVGIAILLASSLNIVNGFAGQFSLGHAGFMLVGGYAAAVVTYYGSIKLWGSPLAHGEFMGSGDLLFIGACIVGGLVAAGAGLLVGLPSLRLRGDYLAIVTLGFGEIVRVVVQLSAEVVRPEAVGNRSMLELANNLGGSLGFAPPPPTYVSPTPWLGGTGHAGIFFAYVFVAIVLIAAYRLKVSSRGRGLLAVRENEIAAEAMGINTSRAKVGAFVMAAFFAGIGGALYAHQFGVSLSPKELGFQKSIDLVIIVVLGGMGSITGVVLAATILTVLPEIFREFAQYRMPIYALAIVMVMIFRPKGLLGIKELWELSAIKQLGRKFARKGAKS